MVEQAVAVALVVFAGSPVSGAAQTSAPGSSMTAKNDYADGKSWLCRPGRTDAGSVDLTTTIVAANGTLTRETWTGNSRAPIDCFYVYPTVSTDPTDNSDMTADAAELNVVRTQFARFGSACRLYAPLYRQVTLAGLQKTLASGATGATERSPLTAGLAYDDASGYLEITVHGDLTDPRVDDIGGDLSAGPTVLANWGLHLIDVDLAIGNLVEIVNQQGKTYSATNKAR